ncbi:MAG: serine/threonine-protein kinase [bacterium]
MFRPTLFGKYLLTHRLAVGGMAEIFKAKVLGVGGFEKDLVVKQILPQYAKYREFVDMFIDEAKITVSLTHGNIVPVYELGRIEGIYFIAMEYVAGRDLSQVLLRGAELKAAFSPEQATAVIIDVLKGLDYAHRRKDRHGEPMGIVHRDVSPQNVVVSFDGEVKILDFGIAKAAQRLVETHPGAVRGKFGYLSPEQARGDPVDRRADIFSAGVVLWELLTARRLFGTSSEAVALKLIQKGKVPPPSSVNPALPPELDPILAKALTTSPDERYKDAAAFQLALSKYLYSSHGAVTSESIGEYMKSIFHDQLEAEEDAEQDPSRLEEVQQLYNELAEKMKGQATDPGRRPRRRTQKTRARHPTEPGIGVEQAKTRTPTQPRHLGLADPKVLKSLPKAAFVDGDPGAPDTGSPKALAVSGNLDHDGKTLPVSEPITTDSVAEHHTTVEALAKAADPNYDLDAFLDELGPAPVEEEPPAPQPAPADKPTLEYEVFASRDIDSEESIFDREQRGPPVGWLLAVLIVVAFAAYLIATQTDIFKRGRQPTSKATPIKYTGTVFLTVHPKVAQRADGTTAPAALYWQHGDSPATIKDLPLGQDHLLLLELTGYQSQWIRIPTNAWARREGVPGRANTYERRVTARLGAGDSKAPLRRTLEPPQGNTAVDSKHTGQLVVDSDPPGARVWLHVGVAFQVERLDVTKVQRFMGLVSGGRRKVVTIRPFKNVDEPGDWRVSPEGGKTVFYRRTINLERFR